MNQSSIFKREFLEKHNIRFNESLGASYQDTRFSFITTILADSLYLLDEVHYCYRTDNESSSSNDKGKVYCICDEYDFIARFLEKENLMDAYFGLFYYLKFCGYWWNVGRIANESKLEFLMRFQKDFAHLSKAQIKSCGFKWHQRRKLAKILDSPRDFYAEILEPKPKGLWQKIKHYLKYDLKFTQKKEQQMQPKVSIIIPCYNVERYVRECMQSVVNQTLRDIEIICINDGSTDSTGAILREFARQDKRIKIFELPNNSGAGVVRNMGIKMAKGEFIAFLDSDDRFYACDTLEILYRTAKENGAKIRGGSMAFKYQVNSTRQSNGFFF